jgi:tetratricopeptide (TPR) repeat protein
MSAPRIHAVKTATPKTRPPRRKILSEINLRKLSERGRLLCRRGQYQKAECALQRALQISIERFGKDGRQTWIAWNDYAVLCKYTGRFSRAETIYLRILGILLSTDDANDSDVATICHNLGGLEHARDRHERGEPFAREAVKIRRRALGANHPLVAADEVALGAILDGLGKHQAAQRLYRRALRIFRAATSPNADEIAVTLNNLAASKYATGRFDAAERFYQEALDLKEKLFGRMHVDVALTLNNLALLYKRLGQRERAATHYKRALSILQGVLSPRHPKLVICRNNYAKLVQTPGRNPGVSRG